jgi:hypothetical protein
MTAGRRWVVRDRYGNDIYLTDERWEHIVEPMNHPEMSAYEEHLKETIQSGKWKQDPLNPQKYRYVKPFDDLQRTTHTSSPLCCFGLVKGRVVNRFPTTTLSPSIRKR